MGYLPSSIFTESMSLKLKSAAPRTIVTTKPTDSQSMNQFSDNNFILLNPDFYRASLLSDLLLLPLGG